MNLHLYSHSPLREIQEIFNRHYPGLKLDFIFKGDEQLSFSSSFSHSFLLSPVDELCDDCPSEDIVLEDDMTTKDAEDLIRKCWHLPAIVYAAINGYWQKNSKTDCSLLKSWKAPVIKN
jgi:hypothetical protein